MANGGSEFKGAAFSAHLEWKAHLFATPPVSAIIQRRRDLRFSGPYRLLVDPILNCADA